MLPTPSRQTSMGLVRCQVREIRAVWRPGGVYKCHGLCGEPFPVKWVFGWVEGFVHSHNVKETGETNIFATTPGFHSEGCRWFFGDDSELSDIKSMKLVLDEVVVGSKNSIHEKTLHALGVCFFLWNIRQIYYTKVKKKSESLEGEVSGAIFKHHRSY